MTFINTIFSWINLISLIILFKGILIIYGKYTPIYIKKKLEGKKLQSWRNMRFFSCIISSVGFYSFTFSNNFHLNIKIELLINIIGLLFIFMGLIISIINNIKKIGKWSSSI